MLCRITNGNSGFLFIRGRLLDRDDREQVFGFFGIPDASGSSALLVVVIHTLICFTVGQEEIVRSDFCSFDDQILDVDGEFSVSKRILGNKSRVIADVPGFDEHESGVIVTVSTSEIRIIVIVDHAVDDIHCKFVIGVRKIRNAEELFRCFEMAV